MNKNLNIIVKKNLFYNIFSIIIKILQNFRYFNLFLQNIFKLKGINKSNPLSPIKDRKLSPTSGKNSPEKSPNQMNLPRNINEYRYMIENFQIRDTDIEWIFELRGYEKRLNYKSLKNVSISQPSFYHDDFEKYHKKVERELKEKSENKLRLKGNTGEYAHLLINRINSPSNPAQFGFDSTLRNYRQYNNIHGPESPWKTLNVNNKKDLLNTYLPPLTKSSIKNIQVINKFVSRPYEPIYDVSKFLILKIFI
jgi:hypothetical protein